MSLPRICVSNISLDKSIDWVEKFFAKYDNPIVVSLSRSNDGPGLRAFIDFNSLEAIERARADLDRKPPFNWELSNVFHNKKPRPDAPSRPQTWNSRPASVAQENRSPNMDMPRFMHVNFETGQRGLKFKENSKEATSLNFNSYDFDDTSSQGSRDDPRLNNRRSFPPRPSTRNDWPFSSMERRNEYPPQHSRSGRQSSAEYVPPSYDSSRSAGRGSQFPRGQYDDFERPKPMASHQDYGFSRPRGRGAQFMNHESGDYPPGRYHQGNESQYNYNENFHPRPENRREAPSFDSRREYGRQCASYGPRQQYGDESSSAKYYQSNFGGGRPRPNYMYDDGSDEFQYSNDPPRNGYQGPYGRASNSHPVNSREPYMNDAPRNEPPHGGRSTFYHESPQDSFQPNRFKNADENPTRGRSSPSKFDRKQQPRDNDQPTRPGTRNDNRSRKPEVEQDTEEGPRSGFPKGRGYKRDFENAKKPGTNKWEAEGPDNFRGPDLRSTQPSRKRQEDNQSDGSGSDGPKGRGFKNQKWQNRPEPENASELGGKGRMHQNDNRRKKPDLERNFKDFSEPKSQKPDSENASGGGGKGRMFQNDRQKSSEGNKGRRFENDTRQKRPERELTSDNLKKHSDGNFRNDNKRGRSNDDNQSKRSNDDNQKRRSYDDNQQRRQDSHVSNGSFDRPKSCAPFEKKDVGVEKTSSHGFLDKKDGRMDRPGGRGTYDKKDGGSDRPKSRAFSDGKQENRWQKKRPEVETITLDEEPAPGSHGDNRSQANGDIPSRSRRFSPTEKEGSPRPDTVSKTSASPGSASSHRLPVGQFSKVIVSAVISPGFFWVQSRFDETKLIQLQAKIQEAASHEAVLGEKVTANVKCLAQFKSDNQWYRARVVSVEGEKIIVTFVDYGNDEICHKTKLKSLPAELSKERPFAFKVKLSDGSPQELLKSAEFDVLEVRPVKKQDDSDFWFVEVKQKGGSAGKADANVLTSVSNKIKEIDSGMKALKLNGEMAPSPVATSCPLPVDSFSEVIVSTSLGPNFFYVQTIEDCRKAVAMSKTITSMYKQQNTLSVVSRGTICLALFKEEGSWYRAKIVDTVGDEVSIIFIDYGNTDKCKNTELKELPVGMQSEKPLAFKIKLSETTPSVHFNKKFGEKLSVKPNTKLTNDTWVVDVLPEGDNESPKRTSESAPQEVSSKKSSPSVRLPKSAKCPIDTKGASQVLLTCYRSKIYYGHPASRAKELLSLHKSLQNGVPSCRLSLPQINSLCFAKQDNEWFRARILDMTAGLTPQVTVVLIDYGDELTCSIDKLRALPPHYLVPPAFASRFQIDSDEPIRLYTKTLVRPVRYSDQSDSWTLTVEPDSSKADASAPATPECPIPVDQFSKVRILCTVKEDTYYGQPATSAKKLDDYHADLQNQKSQIQGSPVVQAVDVGASCFASHAGEWYRARIVSKNPTKVQLIDYGDIVACNPASLREISGADKTRPSDIFKFKLLENASKSHLNKQVYAFLTVKPLWFSEEDECWMVVVEGDPPPPAESGKAGQPSSGSLSPRPQSNVRTKPAKAEEKPAPQVPQQRKESVEPCPIKEGVYSSITILSRVKDLVYHAQPRSRNAEASELFIKMSKIKDAPKLAEPAIGAVCAVKIDGEWYRAKIISLSPVTVEYIDYGVIIKTSEEEVRELPDKFRSKPVYRFKFRLPDNASEKYKHLKEYDRLEVMPVEFNSEEKCWVMAVEGDPEPIVKQSQSARKSPVEETVIQPDSCPIDPDVYTDVIVSCPVASNIYFGYLKSQNDASMRLFNEVQEAAAEAEAGPLRSPAVGGLCLAEMENDWYRAKIMSLTPPFASVSLIDYGDLIDVRAERLKEIPAQLKDRPVFPFKFMLADNASPEHLNKEVYKLLRIRPVRYSSEKGCWIVAVEGDPFDSVPSSSSKHQSSQKTDCPIPLNQFNKVTVTCVADGEVFYGQPSSEDKEMNKLLMDVQKVGVTCPEITNPSVGDLCLVLFSEIWYRGKILNLPSQPKVPPTVQLIDFGDTIQVPRSYVGVITEELKSKPVCCFKFKFTDGTPSQYFPKKPYEKLTLKPLQFDEEFAGWTVALDSDAECDTSPQELVQEISPRNGENKCPLPFNKFTTVIITCPVRRNVFYCQRQDLQLEIAAASTIVQSEASNAILLENPEPKSLCLVPFLGEWHRALILSPESTPLCQLIDLGDVIKYPFDKIRSPAKKLESYPGYAIKIMFSKGTALEYLDRKSKDRISIKPIEYCGEYDCWIVDVITPSLIGMDDFVLTPRECLAF